MENSPIVEGLLRIHKVISRGLNISMRKCDEYLVRQGVPSEEAAGFHMYLKALRWVTHSHHLSEDEIVFPYFTGKMEVPFSRLKEDHHAINLILEELDHHISEASLNNFGELSGLLKEFDRVWKSHIKIEEENFNFEKLKAVMEMDEQKTLVEKIGEHSLKNLGPGPITLPFIFYNLEGSERDEFPWVMKKVLLPVVWRRKWKPMRPFLFTYQSTS